MKILNLAKPEASDIKFEVSHFPDGQQQVNVSIPQLDLNYCREHGVQIKTRLNDFSDLELIICATQSLRNLGVKEIHLYTPYFLGSRSDRKFETGSNNYLKDVICPIINGLCFESVTVLDPHSDVLEACLNNFRKITNEDVVKFALGEIYDYDSSEGNSRMILVSPDAGASKKIYKIAEQIGYKGDIITCSKERDNAGKLSNTVVPDFPVEKDIIIIDDIFDFGGTFKSIGAIMNDMGHEGNKYLIVTHSIQTEGLKDALKWFDCIYTTNSYKEHNIEKVKQFNIF